MEGREREEERDAHSGAKAPRSAPDAASSTTTKPGPAAPTGIAMTRARSQRSAIVASSTSGTSHELAAASPSWSSSASSAALNSARAFVSPLNWRLWMTMRSSFRFSFARLRMRPSTVSAVARRNTATGRV
eukprot:Amastigsp_a510994_13.p4 type:complete len:131 gc:universal Amastigsp_a510994_13:2331-1939(-)